jgi:2-methylcitrate dehydratase PrpD
VSLSRENATVLRNHRPATALDAKFSIEFAMAGALVSGKVGLAELADDFVRREPVQSLFERVHVTPSDDYDPESPGSLRTDQVTVTTSDGRRYDSAAVRYARGHARLPLAPADLRAKFIDCLRHGRFEGDPAAFFDKLDRMQSLSSGL